MKGESLDTSYLVLPEEAEPFPGVVVIHEAFGLNDHIRDVCGRFAREGYAALGVDLFAGREPGGVHRVCSRARWPGTSTTTVCRR